MELPARYVCCLLVFSLCLVDDRHVTGQCVDDPCVLPYPCVQGSVLPDPTDCSRYQRCVAPYEWVHVDCDQGSFSNVTCSCEEANQCHTWGCPVPPTQFPKPSRPCFVDEEYECVEPGVRRFSDRFYCTKFHQCTNGVWQRFDCPPQLPYYDVFLPFSPYCSQDVSRCDEIDFESCLDLPIITVKPTTTQPPTTVPTTTVPTTTVPTTTVPTTTVPTTTVPTSTVPTTTVPTTIVQTTTVPTTTVPTTTVPTTTVPSTTVTTTTVPSTEVQTTPTTSADLTTHHITTDLTSVPSTDTNSPIHTTTTTTTTPTTTQHPSTAATTASTRGTSSSAAWRPTSPEATADSTEAWTSATTEAWTTEEIVIFDACRLLPSSCAAEGENVAHQTLCASFYRCEDGMWTLANCSGNLLFNTVTRKCQRKFLVDCDVRCEPGDGLVSKMTRNIILLAVCGGVGVILVIVVVVLASRSGSSSFYNVRQATSVSKSGVPLSTEDASVPGIFRLDSSDVLFDMNSLELITKNGVMKPNGINIKTKERTKQRR